MSSVDTPHNDSVPTLRQLHNLSLYSPIDSIPLPPTSPPAPRAPARPSRPVVSLPPKVETKVSKVASNSTKIPIKHPIGSRTHKVRRMVDETDFFVSGEHGLFDEPPQKKRVAMNIREKVNMMLDYLELNLPSQNQLPPFPKEFHILIADLAYESFMKCRMHTDNTKIYTVIHECVKQLPNCQDTPFAHFSIFPVDVLYDDAKFEEALQCSNPFMV